jgi:hypothetical protein
VIERVKITWGVFRGLTGTVVEAGFCSVLVEVNGHFSGPLPIASLDVHDVEPELYLVAIDDEEEAG